MSICIEIEVSDDGQVTVGVCPPEEESGEPKGYMKPAQSIDEALAQAKSMLAGGQTQQPAQAQPAQEGDAANAAAAKAFNQIRGGM